MFEVERKGTGGSSVSWPFSWGFFWPELRFIRQSLSPAPNAKPPVQQLYCASFDSLESSFAFEIYWDPEQQLH